MASTLYFKDNFFNSGKTDILSENQEVLGEVDLRSSFGSGLDIYNANGDLMYTGTFPMLSGKWNITNANDEEVGRVRSRLAFFAKKFEYEAYDRGIYEIKSEIFSTQYEMFDEEGTLAASFQRVSGWFSADAYCLENHSTILDSYELVAVVMGMHEIQKRQRSSSNG
ncbi:hypothetical protein EHS13_20925 [Paenibacillus psychroresistens]|uniref:LURP-one-related family protein n=2 Tax=Paenibacillus psychroresistens TaxID=1778678 RepID=A0A6B8RYR7_9BACL|nr:hypothetical protein EHS13_20925 [Paenibacillus psychroresistens]